MYMKNAIINTTNIGNNHIKILSSNIAIKIAIIINIKSLNSM